MKFVVDTNVYDRLVDKPEVQHRVASLLNTGDLEFIATHVQVDEMRKNQRLIPDPGSGHQLLVRELVWAILGTPTPTYGWASECSETCCTNTEDCPDGSKIGLARFGEPERLQVVLSEQGNHTNDALLAETARYERAVLVTDDQRLSKRASRNGITAWSSDRLLEHIAQLPNRVSTPVVAR